MSTQLIHIFVKSFVVLFFVVGIPMCFIVNFIINFLIPKNSSLKKWYRHGIRSFNITIPVCVSFVFSIGFVAVNLTQGAVNLKWLINFVGFIFIVAMICLMVICIPIAGLVTLISYLINRKKQFLSNKTL